MTYEIFLILPKINLSPILFIPTFNLFRGIQRAYSPLAPQVIVLSCRPILRLLSSPLLCPVSCRTISYINTQCNDFPSPNQPADVFLAPTRSGLILVNEIILLPQTF